MAKKYRVGFTLGKFAPLHKGHQLLIETALEECERVIALVYETRAIDVPLPMRADWIRRLYPSVEVIEGLWGGPEYHSSERAYERLHEDYCLEKLGDVHVDAFYCSEFYGGHMAKALGARDRRVDEARTAVPVSGTAVRADPYGMRKFVDPLVYRDLVIKACFVGAPSCGKTTLVNELAERFDTTSAMEYGREYWTEHQRGRRLDPEELEFIAREHQRREELAFADARTYCFVDTCAITTYMFALDYHGSATPGLAELARGNATRYDLFFLCEDDIPYDDTWDRSGDVKRHDFHRAVKADLAMRRIPYVELAGSLEERVEKVGRVLAGFDRFANPFGRALGDLASARPRRARPSRL